MRKIAFIISLLFLLSGCSDTVVSNMNTNNNNEVEDEVENVVETVETIENDNVVIESVIVENEDIDNHDDEEIEESAKSELTSEEYIEIIMAVFDVYDADFPLMVSYFEQAEIDTSLYENDEWINKISESLARISSTHELLKGMSEKDLVPNDYKDFHEVVKQPFSTLEILESTFVGDGIDRESLSLTYLEIMKSSLNEMAISNNELRAKINE